MLQAPGRASGDACTALQHKMPLGLWWISAQPAHACWQQPLLPPLHNDGQMLGSTCCCWANPAQECAPEGLTADCSAVLRRHQQCNRRRSTILYVSGPALVLCRLLHAGLQGSPPARHQHAQGLHVCRHTQGLILLFTASSRLGAAVHDANFRVLMTLTTNALYMPRAVRKLIAHQSPAFCALCATASGDHHSKAGCPAAGH